MTAEPLSELTARLRARWNAAEPLFGQIIRQQVMTGQSVYDGPSVVFYEEAYAAIPRLLAEIDRLELAEAAMRAQEAFRRHVVSGSNPLHDGDEWLLEFNRCSDQRDAAYAAWRAARPDAAGSDEEGA